MGAIARAAANNITTSGVFTSGAITNASVTGITVLANASDGITLISSQTASASATISFTSGLDSTYKAYKFVFSNIHPSSDGTEFSFNLSTDGGSNYNATKTSSHFRALHNESDSATGLSYDSALHLAQSTSPQLIVENFGADNDQSTNGTLTLFNPSSTTYVKHYISTMNVSQLNDYTVNHFVAGYANTTSAVNAIRFQMTSGNIDAGTIYLYGIK